MRSKARTWWKPAVAILLIAVADAWSRQPPELSAAKTVVLETTKARPEEGHAYWISLRWIAPNLVSDKDGVSQLVLLEDGDELSARALHADIRDEGGGLYSHWGNAILFSTRDGSDPRTNGRRYEVRLPPTLPGWHRPARVGLWLAALLLLLHWLHSMLGGPLWKTGVWASVGTVALAALALGSALISSPARELRTIRDTFRQVPDGSISPRRQPEQADANAQRPRTRHLARGGDIAASFDTTAPPPVAQPPRTLILRLSDGAQRPDGRVRLVDGAALHTVDPLDIVADELELLVLELQVTRGESLTLQLKSFETLETQKQTVELSFAVSASHETQIIRFQRPALEGILLIQQIAIQATPGAGEPPLVRVKSLRYSLRLDAFTARHSGLDPVQLGGDLRPALWQSVPGRFSFPLDERDGSLLKVAVGMLSEDPKEVGDYAVALVDSEGRRSVLHRGSVAPQSDWQELTICLPNEGAGELSLEAEQFAPRSALLWSGVRLVDPRRPPRNVGLILADTLRADALGSYGHDGDPTPNLDALARQGARFTRAFSQSYWTRPSMASIITGRYVTATGVQTLDQRLPDSYATLAERFAEGGFTTVGILTNSNAGPKAGLGQGFDRLRLLSSLTKEQQQSTEQLISEVVLPTLDELEGDDVFLYLHLMEPHGPYGPLEPPADFELPAGGPTLPYDRRFDRPWNPRPTAAHRVALYDYDVRRMDRALGDLFEHLDRRWSSAGGSPPVLAFVSDHGEHLGERGQWGHTFAKLHPENVQVPMIIRAPGRIAPNTEHLEPVEVRHLGATLLDLMDLAPEPAEGTGQSLLRILETSAGSTPPFAVSAAEENDRAVFSLFGQRNGYVARIVGDSARVATYSDAELAQEQTGLWPQPILERGLLHLRRIYLRSQEQTRERLWAGQDSALTIDPEALESLKALGYLED